MTFGEKLYQLRTGHGISQEALARKLSVSRQAISRWELGEVIPDTANVMAVSRYFGVSTDYLLDESRESFVEAESKTAHTTVEEEPLQKRQYAVSSAMVCRFFALAGPALYHQNAGREETSMLLPFTLIWTLFFGLLLARSTAKVRKHVEQREMNRLLLLDVLAVCCICFLPPWLKWIPGNWGIFFSQMAAVPFIVKNWNLLRKIYKLPNPPHKPKKHRK